MEYIAMFSPDSEKPEGYHTDWFEDGMPISPLKKITIGDSVILLASHGHKLGELAWTGPNGSYKLGPGGYMARYVEEVTRNGCLEGKAKLTTPDRIPVDIPVSTGALILGGGPWPPDGDPEPENG